MHAEAGFTPLVEASRRLSHPVLFVLAVLLATATLAGCGGEDATDAASPAAPRASASATGEAGAGRLLRDHLAAVGRNDLDAYLAAVADDARFDVGGRAINGREAIGDFFEGELSGGRYAVLRERPSAGGVTFDVDFRRGELLEELTYAYTVRGGRITGLVARYR